MTTPASRPSLAPFKGQQLQLELIDAGSTPLIRAYCHPDADWHPAPAHLRNNHVDPPPPYREVFSVLYTATTIQSIAMEARVLRWDSVTNVCHWSESAAALHRIVRFGLGAPGLFIPIDGPNRPVLGLHGKFEPNYETARWVALELFRRYGHLVHGLSYESFHRHQPGRVYAIWHSRKESLCLESSTDRPRLLDDPDWAAFLQAHPFVQAMDRVDSFRLPHRLDGRAA